MQIWQFIIDGRNSPALSFPAAPLKEFLLLKYSLMCKGDYKASHFYIVLLNTIVAQTDCTFE